MKSRLPLGFWLSVVTMFSVAFWFGCEQKGDLSPIASNRGELTFIDSILVDPPVVSPMGTAMLQANIVTEMQEPAPGEEVRFTVNRGSFAGGGSDTTLVTDNYGRAIAEYTAPEDTGNVAFRTELLSMSEMVTTLIAVESDAPSLVGLLSVWVAEDTLFADNGSSSTQVFARLRNEANNPVGGAVIMFSTTSGLITSPGTTDNVSGIAAATLTSSETVGMAQIIAVYNQTRDTTYVNFLQPAAAAEIVVNSSAVQMTAGADTAVVTAQVMGDNGQPIHDNTIVLFSATRGSFNHTSAPTLGGTATVIYYAPTISGDITITATTGTVNGTTPIDINAGPVASIAATSASDTMYADNTSETQITALCRDSYGNSVGEGTPIAFTALGGWVTPSVLTNADGEAIAIFRSGLSAGPAVLTCTSNLIQGGTTIYLRPTDAAELTLMLDPPSMVANGTSQSVLRALVLDADNRPVSNGTEVTFTSETGIIGSYAPAAGHGSKDKRASSSKQITSNLNLNSSGLKGMLFANSRFDESYRGGFPTTSVFTTTTMDGYAVAALTSSTVAGTDLIMADAGDAHDEQTATYVAGAAAEVIMTAMEESLPADGVSSTQVMCEVVDAYGNTLGGGVAVSVIASLGTVNPPSGFTNSSGTFTTILTTNRTTGNCAVIANADAATGFTEVAFTSPEAESVTLSTNSNSILADGISATLMTAYVADMYGLPVRGTPLNWSTGTGIGWLEPVSNVTDSAGWATAWFWSGASNDDASQQVTATVGEYWDDLMISMRGVTVEAEPATAQLPANGVSTTDVSCMLRETSSGVAVTNATVRFASESGTIQQFGTTNESGVAIATYQSADEPGDVMITCSYGDTLRANTTIHLYSTEAEDLVVELSAPVLLADGVSSSIVTATVFDEGGGVSPNTPVLFTVNGSGYFTEGEVISDANGVAVSTYMTQASEADESVLLEIAIERTSVQHPIQILGVMMNAEAGAETLPANGAATATISVQLRETTSLVGIPEVEVQLGCDMGSIPASATTGDDGVATVTYTAGMGIGMATIIARYGDLMTDTMQIQLLSPSAAQVDLSAMETSMLANGTATTQLSTMIEDQSGLPIAGTWVNWNVTGSGWLSSGQTMTDETGMATNLFHAAASVSNVNAMVHAWSATASDSVAIQMLGITVSATASVASLPANGVSWMTITAQIRETTSLVGVPNATVEFGSSLGSIPSSVTADGSGIAQAQLTAGTTAGNAMVICRYGDLLTDTVTVQMYSPTASLVTVTPEENSIRADGMSSTDAIAYVYDSHGVPLSGTWVTWTASGVPWTSQQIMTDALGAAMITMVSTASASNVNATLTATSGTASGFTMIQQRGVTISCTATPQTVIADGSSTSLINVHLRETTSQIAISEADVYFGTDRGTVPNTAETDVSGVAAVSLTSSTQTGTATVTASFGNTLSATAQVVFAQSTPTTLTMTAAPTVLIADNISTSQLTCTVTDQNGNPVPNGTQVRFSLPPQSGSLENLRTTMAGVATNTLTSSSNPGTVQIIAWAETNSTARDTVSITYTVGSPAIVQMSAQTDSLRADGITTDSISAFVTDAVGHALGNVEVLFTTTIGNITASRVTNAQGIARVPFSSSQTGTATITATAGAAVGNYTLYLVPGNPNSIQLAYFPNSVGVRSSGRNETLLITAHVVDANNNAVLDGTPVSFNINDSPGGGDYLSSTDPIPTINGDATVSYNSGTISGTARIRAVCAGVSAVSTEILIYSGPAFIEDISTGCSSSHMSLGAVPCNMFGMDVVGDSVRIVCLVGDRYNNPVTPGTAVYFTTSGGVITTSAGYTDDNGFAYATLFSGNPLPTISRWTNTITDPNTGTAILCTPTPTQNGVAKILARTAGVALNGDSVSVWATTNVIFDYSDPQLYLRSTTVGGDPNERTLYIGENALIRIALYDLNYWPMVAGTRITFSASAGNVYPNEIIVPCPGDSSYTVSFFNNLTLSDDDAATPVLINVEATNGAAYTFTETFTLHALLPPGP